MARLDRQMGDKAMVQAGGVGAQQGGRTRLRSVEVQADLGADLRMVLTERDRLAGYEEVIEE